MTDTLRDAAQMALDYLQSMADVQNYARTVEALRAALAAPVASVAAPAGSVLAAIYRRRVTPANDWDRAFNSGVDAAYGAVFSAAPEPTPAAALAAQPQEAPKWVGPYADAWSALDATRRAVAELIGADPEAWPDHGNAALAIAAAMAIRSATQPAAEPQPVAPLTDKQILRCIRDAAAGCPPMGLVRAYDMPAPTHYAVCLVRAIEAAHGIGAAARRG